MKLTNALFLLFFGLTILTSCSKSDDSPVTPINQTTYYYPPLTGAVWETVNPADLGWNVSKLNEAIDFIGSNNSDALIILYKGRIVTEKYWNGFTISSSKRIFSATKSMVGFMVGIAQEQGKLDINKKVSDYLGTGWSNAALVQENKITVKNLITMTSGLKDDLMYETAPDTKWYYNTSAYHKTIAVLASAYNQSNTDFTNAQLWSKIGMQNSFWDTEPSANSGGPTMSCSGRDMARFGLLIISDGKWNGNTIMGNSSYFQSMLNSSQNLNPAYGYLWWLNGKSSYTEPSTNKVVSGALIPAAPADLVSALGANDKKIYVLKSKDVVIIRHGGTSNFPSTLAQSAFDNEIWTRMMLAIK